VSSTRVTLPAPGSPAEKGRDARARVWAFVFACWQKNTAETNSSREDDPKSSHATKRRLT
jgi:hypothetical protein